MNFFLIGLGVVAVVFGFFQLLFVTVAVVTRSRGFTSTNLVARSIYIGLGVGLGLWLFSLGGLL